MDADMDDWLERFGEALAAELGEAVAPPGEWEEPEAAGADVGPWAASPRGHDAAGGAFDARADGDMRESLLELARVVAHATERRNAPLATFLAGRFVAARVAQGATAAAATDEARAIAEQLLD